MITLPKNHGLILVVKISQSRYLVIEAYKNYYSRLYRSADYNLHVAIVLGFS